VEDTQEYFLYQNVIEMFGNRLVFRRILILLTFQDGYVLKKMLN